MKILFLYKDLKFGRVAEVGWLPTYRNVKTLSAHGDIVCKRHVGRNERIHTSNHAGSNPAALNQSPDRPHVKRTEQTMWWSKIRGQRAV